MPKKPYRHDGGAGSDWVAAVGTRLRWARELATDTQTQAARLLECDQSTLSGYEHGDRLLPINVAMRACQVWGLTLDYLYRGRLSSEVRHDMAVALAAAHPDLVLGSEEAQALPAKVAATAA